MGTLEEAAEQFRNASSDEARDRAFQDFAVELQRLVLPIIRLRCFEQDDVESVLQETLVKIATNLDGLESRERLRAWAIQIASNTAHNFNRTRSRKMKPVLSLDELNDAIESGIRIQNPPLRPDELARINEMREVIGTLGKRCQELLTEALDGLTAREISEKSGDNLESVASSLARCRKLALEAWRKLERNA